MTFAEPHSPLSLVLVLAGSLWHKDCWLPCTERSYYRRSYAIKNQRGALPSKAPSRGLWMRQAGSLWHKRHWRSNTIKLSTNESRASTNESGPHCPWLKNSGAVWLKTPPACSWFENISQMKGAARGSGTSNYLGWQSQPRKIPRHYKKITGDLKNIFLQPFKNVWSDISWSSRQN